MSWNRRIWKQNMCVCFGNRNENWIQYLCVSFGSARIVLSSLFHCIPFERNIVAPLANRFGRKSLALRAIHSFVCTIIYEIFTKRRNWNECNCVATGLYLDFQWNNYDQSTRSCNWQQFARNSIGMLCEVWGLNWLFLNKYKITTQTMWFDL